MADTEKVVYAYEILEKELEVLSIWEAERRVNAVKRPAAKKVKREKEIGGSEKPEGTMQSSKRLDHLPCQIDKSRSKKKLYYHGVEVEFPFAEPLAPQRQVMEGVVRAILKRECALLESPTGTGKTQALLSASLAAQRYLQEKGEPVGKIIFATRTIGQVRQLPAELRKNPYMALSAPLASRSHYCTNEAINSLPNHKLSNECRKMGRLVERLRKPARDDGGQGESGGCTTQDACGCSLYMALTNRKHAANVHSAARYGALKSVKSFKNNYGRVVDIEDLRGTPNISDLCALSGRYRTLESDMQKDDEQADKHPMGCAYYTARALAKQSHITFCTYNYLMSPGIRDAVGISSILSDSIVIIDEAHNVESVARDGGSVDISLFEIYLLQQFVECRTGKLRDQILKRGDKEEETIIEGGTLRELLDTIRLKMEEAEDAFVGTAQTSSPFFSGMPPKITQAERSLKSRAQYHRPPTDRDVVAGFDWGAAGRRPPTSHFFDQFDLKGRLVHNAHAEAEVIAKAAREVDDDSFVLADQCLAFTTAMVLLSAHRAHYAVCVRAWHNQGADYRQSFQPPKQLDSEGSGGDDQRQSELVFNGSGQVAFSNRLAADAQATTPLQPQQNGHNWWSATRKRRPISPVWGFELSVMLLHPGIMIDGLSTKVRALVLASGTLSPVEKTERELGEQFAKRMKKKALEAKHVVCTKHQLAIRAVTSASVPRRGHVELECTANSLNSNNYESQNLCFGIGETIATLSEIAPGGMLVFFPSHKALNRLVHFWQRRSNEYGEPESSRNIWQRLLRAKRTVLIEVTDAVENDNIIAKYRAAIASPQKSALLLCAFRGKCSEGISFNDDACRLVICVGIPNLPCFDHIVVRKQDYNNAKIAGGKDLGCANAADVKCMSGRMWYTTQAFRALNQALGRCIRHLNDYGSIVLCDTRFQSLEHRRHVAAWIRDAIECGDLKQVARHMTQHFAAAPAFVRREYRERMGLPAVKAKPTSSLHCVQRGTNPDAAARARPPASSSERRTKASTRNIDVDGADMLLAAENLVAISGDETVPAADAHHAKTARKENLESRGVALASVIQRGSGKKMQRTEQRHGEILFDYDLNETQSVPRAEPGIAGIPPPGHFSDVIVIDDHEDSLLVKIE